MSTTLALLIGKEHDFPRWVEVFSRDLKIRFEREEELFVGELLGTEILLYPWSFGDDEEDYEDPELKGLEWVSYSLAVGKLHGRWHDLEMCVRRAFVLILHHRLESDYGLRTQPFHDVQLRIHRGYGGVLPRRKYRGRDTERFRFGEEIHLQIDGLSEAALVERLREFMAVDIVPEARRTSSFLGMPISIRAISHEEFVIVLEKIPGVHVDDDLTFRMGLGLLLSDYLTRPESASSVRVATEGGHTFDPSDVPLCTKEVVPRTTSLTRLSGQELLSPVKLNPTLYLPDLRPQRLLAFIEGYNAACFPERPLISMNTSSEFGDLVAASDSRSSGVAPIHFVEQYLGYEVDALSIYLSILQKLPGRMQSANNSRGPNSAVPSGLSVRVVEFGPTLEKGLNALRGMPRVLGPSLDGYQLAAFLSGHRFASGETSETARFMEHLRVVYSLVDSDRWSWARALWLLTGNELDLLGVVGDHYKQFQAGTKPLPDSSLDEFRMIYSDNERLVHELLLAGDGEFEP